MGAARPRRSPISPLGEIYGKCRGIIPSVLVHMLPQSAEVPCQRSEAISDVLAACIGCLRGGLLTLGYGLIHRNHVLYAQGRALKFCYRGFRFRNRRSDCSGNVIPSGALRLPLPCGIHGTAISERTPPFSSKIPLILAVGPVLGPGHANARFLNGKHPADMARRLGQTPRRMRDLAGSAAPRQPIRGLAVCPATGPAAAPLIWPVRRSPSPRCVPRGGRSPRVRRTTRPPEPPAGTPPPPAR